MALDTITKQSYEEFRIDVDFGLNMDAAEELAPASCSVAAWDSSGATCTSAIFDNSTKIVLDGSQTNSSLQALIRGGVEANSPYKLTFYGVTDLTPPHKWEKDLRLKIKES